MGAASRHYWIPAAVTMAPLLLLGVAMHAGAIAAAAEPGSSATPPSLGLPTGPTEFDPSSSIADPSPPTDPPSTDPPSSDPPGSVPSSLTITSIVMTDTTAAISFSGPANGAPVQYIRIRLNGVASMAASTSSPITMTGLTPSTSYTVTLQAGNPAGDGPESAPSTFRTHGRPSAVADSSITGWGADWLTLSWTPAATASGESITGYEAEALVAGRSAGSCTAPADGTSCRITGLVAGATTQITVSARNAYGLGEPSTPVTGRAGAPAAPGTPTLKIVDMGSVLVTWTAPAANAGGTAPITGYTAAVGGRTCTTTGALSCTISRLAPSTIVATVRAQSMVGLGPASPPSSATVVGRAFPPPSVSIVQSGSTLDVAWEAPPGALNSTRYEVSVDPAQTCASTGPRSCRITRPSVGQRLTVSVRTRNLLGASAPATATYLVLGPPKAPVNLDADPGDGSLAVSWDPGSRQPQFAPSEYVVEVMAGVFGSPVVEGCRVTAPTRRCTVTGLTNGENVLLSVRAINAAGDAWVAPIVASASPGGDGAQREPGAPTDVRATYSARDNSITVRWTPPRDTGGAKALRLTAIAYPGNFAMDFQTPARYCVVRGVSTCVIRGIEPIRSQSGWEVVVQARNSVGLAQSSPPFGLKVE